MERILSDNEKIRRAEEIYYRRNHKNISFSEPKVRNKSYLGSKIILEMLILILTVTVVFAIKNKDYIFSQEFLTSLGKYNVDLNEKINSFKEFFQPENNVNSGVIENNTVIENVLQQNIVNQSDLTNEINNTSAVENTIEQNVVNSQSSENNISFIKPIDGVITSRFGSRTIQKNTENHTGIDLGAVEGTEIKASISGIVTQVSNEGNYGNHVKISYNNYDTLYAHCKDIYVSEGQNVNQGQVIASVRKYRK